MKPAPLGILLASFVVCSSPQTEAQTSGEEKADLLGTPVKIDEAARFAASFATFMDLCNHPFENAGVFNEIIRFEFGSLSLPDQQTYKTMMIRQYQSNTELWKSVANDSAERGLCMGLENAITARTAEFIRLHPLFSLRGTLGE